MFIFSILSILFSSYFFLSVLEKKLNFKNNIGFVLFLLLNFSQIILSFEILSVFKQIKTVQFLILNAFIFIFSIILWIKNNKYIYKPKITDEFKRIKNALKCDKLLHICTYFYIIFIISMIFMALFYPILYGDALGYYFSRCTMWIQNSSLTHYVTSDSRELIMPINMELLYSWVLLFTKNEQGTGIFSFLSYINAVVVIYNFLGELKFCIRKRLWTIFVFSSLALVFLECYTPIADLFTGSLILTSIYLFYCAVKNNNISLIFFSSLAYALSIGTKTTALIALPVYFCSVVSILFFLNKNQFKKYISLYILFLIFNFLIFSSYNYILNFIEFKNPLSDTSSLLLNQFRGSIKGYLTNLIKYTFIIFDFSGVIDFFNIGNFIQNIQDKFLNILGANRGTYTSSYFNNYFFYNSKLKLTESAFGLMGLLAFFPSLIRALFKREKRGLILFILALFYILNILIFSRTMVFTKYNIRYLLAFLVVSSPVIVYSYFRNNNIYKYICVIFLFVYLVLNSHVQPVSYIISYFKHKPMNNKNFILKENDELKIYNYFINKKKTKIAVMIYSSNHPVYYIYKLRLYGFRVNNILPEIIENYDLSDYEYIITLKDSASSTIIKDYKNLKNNKYCYYKDYEGNIIKMPSQMPAMVTCQIPLDYIIKSGFIPDFGIRPNSYIIFKNISHTKV